MADTDTVTTTTSNLTAGLASLTFTPRQAAVSSVPALGTIPDAVWQHVEDCWAYFSGSDYDGESVLTVTLPDEATAKQWAAQFQAAAASRSSHTDGKAEDLFVRYSPFRGDPKTVRSFRMRTAKAEAERKAQAAEAKRIRDAAEAAKK